MGTNSILLALKGNCVYLLAYKMPCQPKQKNYQAAIPWRQASSH